jgi:hypothetical protein
MMSLDSLGLEDCRTLWQATVLSDEISNATSLSECSIYCYMKKLTFAETDPSLFVMSIGNLSPNEQCVVTIQYATTLDMALNSKEEDQENSAVKFTLPIARCPTATSKDSKPNPIEGLTIKVNVLFFKIHCNC